MAAACFSSNDEELTRLLLAGADANTVDGSGMRPLHWTASRGSLAATEALINSGAEVNARNRDGWTPLHWACRARRLDVVRALLSAGADARMLTATGRSAAQMAGDDAQIKQLLRAHGGAAADGLISGDGAAAARLRDQARELLGRRTMLHPNDSSDVPFDAALLAIRARSPSPLLRRAPADSSVSPAQWSRSPARGGSPPLMRTAAAGGAGWER